MPKTIGLDEKVAALRRFYRDENRLPGYAEMMELFKYRSKNAVFGLLKKLEESGFLRRDARGKHAPTRMLSASIKVLGSVAAGFPSPAEEELVDVLSLEEFLVRRPDATFILNVTGDSMIDAGIHPGDMVLVERGAKPKNGAVVVAQVDEEWTLKYYQKDNDGIRLEPANAKYKTLRPKQSLVIGGVVRAVIRKYD